VAASWRAGELSFSANSDRYLFAFITVVRGAWRLNGMPSLAVGVNFAAANTTGTIASRQSIGF
jgi:hypothetical protein